VTDHVNRPAIESPAFTDAMSLAANGVSIVATDGDHGRAGLTVSSMCSVCAEPSLILACVNADNEFCVAADNNGVFSINLLNTEHVELASIFAGLGDDPPADRFAVGSWQKLKTGSPALEDALVVLDCVLHDATTHGTHRIYIGRVVDVATRVAEPLVYARRHFAQAVPLLT